MPYIPPNARKKTKEVTNFTPAENDFPQLGASGGAKPTWKGRSFAALADDWRKEAEDSKNTPEKEVEPEVEPTFTLPRFNNVRRIVEEEPEKKVEQEWTRVEGRKLHVKKEVDLDILYPEPEDTPEESVWKDNAPPAHETVWDERRG